MTENKYKRVSKMTPKKDFARGEMYADRSMKTEMTSHTLDIDCPYMEG